MSIKPTQPHSVPRIQRVVSILWPSFITAGIANSLFFVVFDPFLLAEVIGITDTTRTAVYSVGFLLFWVLTALSCLLTSYFLRPCHILIRSDSSSHDK